MLDDCLNALIKRGKYTRYNTAMNDSLAQDLKKISENLLDGRLDEVERLCRRILRRVPGQPDALHFLARVFYDRGEVESALSLVEEALTGAPGEAALHNTRGILLKSLGREEESRQSFRRALRLQPVYLDACINLAVLGCYEESEKHFARRIAGQPDDCKRYGLFLLQRRQFSGAAKWLEQALRQQPEDARLWDRLGLALRNLGQYGKAEDAYRQALRLQPDFASAHSALLSMLGYHVLLSPEQLLNEHLAWDRMHGGGETRQGMFCRARPDDSRQRLRIGYVSPDFYRHAVSSFIEPILEHHDRGQVEVFCYAEVHHPDGITRRLQDLSDVWRSTVGMDDEAVARMIHADGIDVLVDLAGHSHSDRTRIGVFTYKPAPVQASYLGYFCTTGLRAMDYWISDEITHPSPVSEPAVEQIYRLPRCCVCYRPPEDAPPVVDRTATPGEITFGCFNDLTKIGDVAIDCWSRILRVLPGSRLVLKAGQLADQSARVATAARFARHGVSASRLEMLSYTSTQREHLALYNSIDIALDTAPRTGVTTTADALYMGVPVITMAGQRFIERLGASLLSSVGLEDLIAANPDEYAAKALALSEGRMQRHELRRRMLASPLCDGEDLARALERAFREMWDDWRSQDGRRLDPVRA